MVVCWSVMPSQNVAPAHYPRQGSAPQDPGGGVPENSNNAVEVQGGPGQGSEGELPPYLARLVAVARHGNMATLPPSQRHLVARVLMSMGDATHPRPVNAAFLAQQRQRILRRQRRLIVLAQRIQNRKHNVSNNARDVRAPLFKEPLPPAPKPNSPTPVKRKRDDSKVQWIPVSVKGQTLGSLGTRTSPQDQWRPFKIDHLCSPTSPLPSQSSPQHAPSSPPSAPSSPKRSPSPPCPSPSMTLLKVLTPSSPKISLGSPSSQIMPLSPSCSPPGPAAPSSPTTEMELCIKQEACENNPLEKRSLPKRTRIPIVPLKGRDLRRRSKRRRMQREATLSDDNTSHAASCGPGNACCLGSHKFAWVNQLTRIFLQEAPEDGGTKEAEGEASAPTKPFSQESGSGEGGAGRVEGEGTKVSQTTPVVSTLGGTGMSNPFARAGPQTTWGSESSDQKPILAPPRLGPPSDAGPPKSSGIPVIRPSALGAGRGPSLFTPPTLTVTNSSPPQPSKPVFKLKPSVLSGSANPFAKPISDSEDKSDAAMATSPEKVAGPSEESKPSPAGPSASPTQEDTKDEEGAEARTSDDSPSKSLFVPLSRNGDGGADSSLSPGIGRNNFIFGQNVQSKVLAGEGNDSEAATTNGDNPTPNLFTAAAAEVIDSGAATNGQVATGNLFSEAASGISQTSDWNSTQSLAESSRELTEKEKSQKRKFDQVEVITGEESESNVLQMMCKLHSWDRGSWQERGRGILRLNDWDVDQEIHSRLVIRTQGTKIVILNTKVWSDMSVERVNNKHVRFTALDLDGQPKIFLASGSPKDIDLLYNSLEWRVAASRSQSHEEGSPDASKKTKKEDSSESLAS